jgi:hypothetical protein
MLDTKLRRLHLFLRVSSLERPGEAGFYSIDEQPHPDDQQSHPHDNWDSNVLYS